MLEVLLCVTNINLMAFSNIMPFKDILRIGCKEQNGVILKARALKPDCLV